jgi:hypothetical protein
VSAENAKKIVQSVKGNTKGTRRERGERCENAGNAHGEHRENSRKRKNGRARCRSCRMCAASLSRRSQIRRPMSAVWARALLEDASVQACLRRRAAGCRCALSVAAGRRGKSRARTHAREERCVCPPAGARRLNRSLCPGATMAEPPSGHLALTGPQRGRGSVSGLVSERAGQGRPRSALARSDPRAVAVAARPRAHAGILSKACHSRRRW